MESCRLAELKYAIFSGTGRNTKKLRCSKLFLSTVSKHGLLEGYTFQFQYNSGRKAVACDHPQEGVNYHLSSPELDKPYVIGKLSISEA